MEYSIGFEDKGLGCLGSWVWGHKLGEQVQRQRKWKLGLVRAHIGQLPAPHQLHFQPTMIYYRRRVVILSRGSIVYRCQYLGQLVEDEMDLG